METKLACQTFHLPLLLVREPSQALLTTPLMTPLLPGWSNGARSHNGYRQIYTPLTTAPRCSNFPQLVLTLNASPFGYILQKQAYLGDLGTCTHARTNESLSVNFRTNEHSSLKGLFAVSKFELWCLHKKWFSSSLENLLDAFKWEVDIQYGPKKSCPTLETRAGDRVFRSMFGRACQHQRPPHFSRVSFTNNIHSKKTSSQLKAYMNFRRKLKMKCLKCV